MLGADGPQNLSPTSCTCTWVFLYLDIRARIDVFSLFYSYFLVFPTEGRGIQNPSVMRTNCLTLATPGASVAVSHTCCTEIFNKTYANVFFFLFLQKTFPYYPMYASWKLFGC